MAQMTPFGCFVFSHVHPHNPHTHFALLAPTPSLSSASEIRPLRCRALRQANPQALNNRDYVGIWPLFQPTFLLYYKYQIKY